MNLRTLRSTSVPATRKIVCGHCGSEHLVVDGRSLQSYRVSMDVSQSELAAELGVSTHWLYMLESNRRTCTDRWAQKIKIAVADLARKKRGSG